MILPSHVAGCSHDADCHVGGGESVSLLGYVEDGFSSKLNSETKPSTSPSNIIKNMRRGMIYELGEMC